MRYLTLFLAAALALPAYPVTLVTLERETPFEYRCFAVADDGSTLSIHANTYADAVNECATRKAGDTGRSWKVQGPTAEVVLVEYDDGTDPPIDPDPEQPAGPAPAPATAPVLTVTADGRQLLRDGAPFFWFGDTVWQIARHGTLEEIDEYVALAAAAGFTVLHGPIWFSGGAEDLPPWGDHPNAIVAGDGPPWIWKAPHIQRIDRLVEQATARGLVVMLSPIWGPHSNRLIGKDIEKARSYGKAACERYADYPNVVWNPNGEHHKIQWRVAAGVPVWQDFDDWDRSAQGQPLLPIDVEVLRAMAEGCESSKHPASLITMHPDAHRSASENFRGAPWLDFITLQSYTDIGRSRADINTERKITPGLPVVESELCYEAAAAAAGACDAWGVRQSAYQTFLSGAAGYSYGAVVLWQFSAQWRDALTLPGRQQLTDTFLDVVAAHYHADNRPAQDLLADPGTLADARNGKGITAMVTHDDKVLLAYSANGRPIVVDTRTLAAGPLQGRLVDPRTGVSGDPFVVQRAAAATITPNATGPGLDTLLIIEPADVVEPPPGSGVVLSEPMRTYNGTLGAIRTHAHAPAYELPQGHIVARGRRAAGGGTTLGLFSKDADGDASPGHIAVFFSDTGNGGAARARIQTPGGDHIIQNFSNLVQVGVDFEVIASWGPSGFGLWLNGQRLGRLPAVTAGLQDNPNPIAIGGLNWTAVEGTGQPLVHPFVGDLEVTVHDTEYQPTVTGDTSPPSAGGVVLNVNPPRENYDGTAIAAPLRYTLYAGRAPRVRQAWPPAHYERMFPVKPQGGAFKAPPLAAGRWFLALTATDARGEESGYSEEIEIFVR